MIGKKSQLVHALHSSPPKRPMSAYMCFLAWYRKKWKEEHGEQPAAQRKLCAAAGAAWARMGPSDKAPYVQASDQSKRQWAAHWQSAREVPTSQPSKAQHPGRKLQQRPLCQPAGREWVAVGPQERAHYKEWAAAGNAEAGLPTVTESLLEQPPSPPHTPDGPAAQAFASPAPPAAQAFAFPAPPAAQAALLLSALDAAHVLSHAYQQGQQAGPGSSSAGVSEGPLWPAAAEASNAGSLGSSLAHPATLASSAWGTGQTFPGVPFSNSPFSGWDEQGPEAAPQQQPPSMSEHSQRQLPADSPPARQTGAAPCPQGPSVEGEKLVWLGLAPSDAWGLEIDEVLAGLEGRGC